MFDRLKILGHSMITRMNQMEVITNNLANIDTTGFKRDELFMNELDKKLKEMAFTKYESKTHIPSSGAVIDFTQGGLKGTGRPLDVAFSGEGLFVVEAPQGEVYTRDGRFTLSEEGLLVTLDGLPVLGEGGPIELDLQTNTPEKILINDSGEILLDGAIVDTLKIVGIDDPQNLIKIGGNLYKLADGAPEPNPPEHVSLRQGFLEDSNVDPIYEMVTMMEVLQFYEMNQKMIREEDRLLGSAVREIGRIG